MHRLFFLLVATVMLAAALPQAAFARGPGGSFEAEREQRREELRQQMTQERHRLREERGGDRPPPRQRPDGPGLHPQRGADGPGRLSPEERRELRQDLRRQGVIGSERRER